MGELAIPRDSSLAKREHRDERQDGDIRSPFQHDKDRILHSTAFRRLQYKTQVYVIHEGDFYRTRLTHSLEVAQIARGIAQQLKADSDLAEAIALAHDLGHAPFGHVGGDMLHHLLHRYGIPFDHNVQSFRIVTLLEERYTNCKGLNLTYATLEGILRHSSFFDNENDIVANIPAELTEKVSRYWTSKQPTIEAQIVNVADVIAYASHDLEDALEVGLMDWSSFCKSIESHNIGFLKTIVDDDLAGCVNEYNRRNKNANSAIVAKIQNRVLARLVIDKLIRETVAQTKGNIAKLRGDRSPLWEEIRSNQDAAVALPQPIGKEVTSLVKDLLIAEVYREPRVMVMLEKGKRILTTLFKTFMRTPEALPKRTQSRLEVYYSMDKEKQCSKDGKRILAQVVADYVSGMTDKYAMDTYQLLTQAYEKAL